MASFISLLFLSLFYTTLSKVYVYSPQQLIEEVKKETGGHDGFEMSLANFGIIPYGHSLIGRIYYDTENADGCEPYGEFDFSGDPDDDKHPTPIILANRGNWTFVKKIRNIEHAGGRLGIVIDNTVEEAKNIIMSDDGSGMGITIPSFLISKKDGKILTDFLAKYGGTHVHRSKPNKQIKTNETEGDSSKNTTTSNEGRKDINGNLIEENDSKIVKQSALFVTFELPHPDQRVEYDIWYSSVDDRALDFMVEFREYDEKFSELVLMTPHFVSWSWEAWDSKFKEDEWFGNGKYWAIAHKRVKMSGKEIILEDLRQRCIYDKTYKNDRSVFWKYIKEVHENCPSYIIW